MEVYPVIGSRTGARARSATRAVDRAGVAQDTQQFRRRPVVLVRRAPWQRSDATLRRPVSPQVLPETKRKQAWHSPVSPFPRVHPYRGLYLNDVMAITKRSFVRNSPPRVMGLTTTWACGRWEGTDSNVSASRPARQPTGKQFGNGSALACVCPKSWQALRRAPWLADQAFQKVERCRRQQ